MNRDAIIQKLIDVDAIDGDLDAAAAVICMSEVLREACLLKGVSAEKLSVLGNRVSITRFTMRPQPDERPDVIHVLFVGRLQEQKNLHGVARALSILKNQGWKVRFDVCGGQDPGGYLDSALSALEPGDWAFWGSVPNRDLPERYRSVDMYVGPSFFEGFQIPLIEALACGRPCVASDQAPASEIIHNGVGVLVDPSDPNAIAQGILSIKKRLNDPQAGRLLRQACRQEAEAKWSYEAVSVREADLYERILRGLEVREK